MKHVVGSLLVAIRLFANVAIAPSLSLAQCCGSEQCAGDLNCDGQVTVDELIVAVNNALQSCAAPVSADQACTDLAIASCTKLDQCVFNGTTARYGGASTCRQRQKQACMVRLGAAGTGNSPSDVEGCVSLLPSSSCNDFDLGNIPECQARIGSGATGAPCAFGGQCQSSNCAIVTGTNCGPCAGPNAAGDSCATTSCSHGFACVKGTLLCQPIGSGGASCDTDHPCGAGLSCVTPSGSSSGTCETAGSSLGAACDPKRQTAPGCDANAGLYCDGTTNSCANVTYVTAGAQCGSVNHVGVGCTNASTCFGAQGSTPGTCIADAANGAPCDTQAGPACVPPAGCVTGGPAVTSGICRLPDPTVCH